MRERGLDTIWQDKFDQGKLACSKCHVNWKGREQICKICRLNKRRA